MSVTLILEVHTENPVLSPLNKLSGMDLLMADLETPTGEKLPFAVFEMSREASDSFLHMPIGLMSMNEVARTEIDLSELREWLKTVFGTDEVNVYRKGSTK